MDVSTISGVNNTITNIFTGVFSAIASLFYFLINPHTWMVVGVVSSVLTLIFIAIIIFSLVRLFEIQAEEMHHMDHEIHEALEKMKESNRVGNPRWHYILTLIESPNESDWRVAIIEADTLMEEALRERGFTGQTVSELLESANSSGYSSIPNAWEAHKVRNQIAHEGVNFPLSQVEGRRVIRMYQNFFEDMAII